MKVLLFPSQLFSAETLRSSIGIAVTDIVFVEHPLFYGKRPGSGAVASLNLNQVRLAYMYVTHRRYVTYLKKQSFRVTVFSLKEMKKDSYGKSEEKVYYIDPCDHLLEADILRRYPAAVRKDSPSFLLTRDQLSAHTSKKRLQHGDFYNTVKELRKDIPVLKSLIGVKNLDKENRAPYRAGMPMPPSPFKKTLSVS